MTGLAVAVVLAAVAVVWTRLRYVVVRVNGDSMAPTYRSGDLVLVRRARPGTVRRGQVVVFAEETPPEIAALLPGGRSWAVKRAAAVPDDPVPARHEAGPHGGGRVPAACLFVLGDNSEHSFDSRHFGFVPEGRVLGVVVRRLGS
ncbi:S26 family signal peptidase [Nonomuraea sp. SMC257]|uniref:signal peptidase I n=1 Tax=Nonomuraea montanisoli TaxID=2741721 RepID=A0A7Y6I2B9_9ACTN|nr:S26 family signal peptidase [Nonomuraea montanisoli]NUW30418.1 S26 family signal peptidase [Nonomuraea montanisoli]